MPRQRLDDHLLDRFGTDGYGYDSKLFQHTSDVWNVRFSPQFRLFMLPQYLVVVQFLQIEWPTEQGNL